jgi:hypothetical protein
VLFYLNMGGAAGLAGLGFTGASFLAWHILSFWFPYWKWGRGFSFSESVNNSFFLPMGAPSWTVVHLLVALLMIFPGLVTLGLFPGPAVSVLGRYWAGRIIEARIQKDPWLETHRINMYQKPLGAIFFPWRF